MIICTSLWHIEWILKDGGWMRILYLVTCLVPITNEKLEFGLRFGKWNSDDCAIVNSNWTKTSSSLLEIDGREVEEGANLIFQLEYISPIPTGLDWAICTWNSILPRVQSLLYAIPMPTNDPLIIDLKGLHFIYIKHQNPQNSRGLT